MQVNVEDLSRVKKRIEVELPPEQVRAELDRAYERIQRRVKIKGFRPGRVPRKVLERHFGAQVREEVTAELISRSYREAVAQKALDVVADPRIEDIEAASVENGLRYRATVEVKPAVELREYLGLEIEAVHPQVDEQEVEETLERLRHAHAQMAAIEDRDQVEKGDLVQLDYTAIVDGRPLPAASANDRVIEVGAGAVPEEFESQLIGMRRGETRRIEVSFPRSHPNASLAGKRVVFRVELKRLGRKELPTLDDEFAKDCGDAGSLEELKGKIREQLREVSRRAAERSLRSRLLDRLIEKNPIEVPDGMVELRLDAMLREVGISRRAVEVTGELAAKIEGLRAKLRPQAHRDVCSALLLAEVARREGVEVSDDEVRSRMALYVSGSGGTQAQAARLFQDPAAREQTREQMLREKALELLMGNARIVEAHENSQVIADERKKS